MKLSKQISVLALLGAAILLPAGAKAEAIPVAFELDAPSSVREAIVKKLASGLEDVEGIKIVKEKSDALAVVRLQALPVKADGRVVAFSFAGSVSSSSDQKVMDYVLKLLRESSPEKASIWSLMEFLMNSNTLRTAEFHAVGTDGAFDEVMGDLRRGLGLLVKQQRATEEKIASLKRTSDESPRRAPSGRSSRWSVAQ